jgi:hypothetical protein
MKRVGYYLTEKQFRYLKKVSKITGLSVSELIRRIIDGYIKEESDEKSI